MRSPTTASSTIAIHSFQSLANLGRFKVLKDKTFTMQNPNSSYDGTNIEQQGLKRTFKFVIKFAKPVTVSFNAVNGGTISDIVDNSWCIYATAASSQLSPTMEYTGRAYYKEL